MSHRASFALRLVTLSVVLGNVAFNYLQARLGPGPSVGAVSARFANPLTPASYAFAIWGLIYAAMIVQCGVALLPSRRREVAHDRLAPPLLAANLLGALWIGIFTQGWIVASVFVIVLDWAAALAFFVQSHRAVWRNGCSLWITVPGSLLLGWLSMAVLANVAAALTSVGFDGGPLGPSIGSVVLLFGMCALVLVLAVRNRDFIVPLVATWATVAIWVANREQEPLVACTALVVGLGCALVAALMGRARLVRP